MPDHSKMHDHELAKKWNTRFVPGEGPNDAKIMLIGEGPGADEEKQGRPFVGRAGKLLRGLLEKAGFDPAKVYITNVVKFRPPDNRKPTPSEIESCAAYLQEEITEIKPKVIVLLGDTALKALLGDNYFVTRDNGKVVERNGVKYMIAPHPSAGLRFVKYKEMLEEDLENLKKIMQQPEQKKIVGF